MKHKIEQDLKRIVGEGNVFSDNETCYVYSQDGTNQREFDGMADCVVFVRNIEEVQKIVKIANENEIPVICRGAGTNLVGACTPEKGGIILNCSKMNQILEINSHNLTATVQPGVVIEDLLKEVEKVGLFYPPDPSNLAVSTIGGSIAQGSAGPKTFKYGSTRDYVLQLKVVLADGSILVVGSNTIKNATGYHLHELFIGSEGTLGIVVEAVLKLIPKPQAKSVIMAYFDTMYEASKAVDNIISNRLTPATIDFMDKNSIQTVEKFYPTGLLCDKEAALIIEVDGYDVSVDYQKKEIVKILENSNASQITFSNNDDEAEKIWTARRSSFAAATKLAPNVMTEDVIVPRSNLAKLVEGVAQICENNEIQVCMVGHVGDGNLHPQMALDLRDETQYNNYVKSKKEIYELTLSLGGTLSGEHGIGNQKKLYIESALERANIQYMKEIKKVFDPKGILNPDKIFKAR